MEEIGQKIRKIRELRNISQKYVAEKLGITVAGFSKIERNGDVTIGKLRKIAEALEVEMQQILDFDEKKIFNFSNSTISQNQNVVGYVESQQFSDQNHHSIINLLKDELTYTREELKDTREELKSTKRELNQLKEQNQTPDRRMAA